MILRRFYDDKLAQASYLVGCAATGEALVVDPNRDIEQYTAAAAAEGLRVTHVTETHIHADFVSGARELAARSGGRLLLSDEGGEGWRYGYAGEARAVLLRDGDSFAVGRVRIDVLHTPGHTPEHLCFVVTDTVVADRPIGVCTGDFVFVGDVGRPDLLERAARQAGTMEGSARTLFRSLQRFKRELADFVQIWPGHGAGSACGKALGAVPQSTVGYERLFNWGLAAAEEEAFVREVLSGQPEPPRYFARMKKVNRDGPTLLAGRDAPVPVPAGGVQRLLHGGALMVDVRPAPDFAAGHLPGSVSLPLNRSFSTWAGSVLPYDRDLYLVVGGNGDGNAATEAVRDLAMVGLDRVAGIVTAAALTEWRARGGSVAIIQQIGGAQLAERLAAGEVTLLDVRRAGEWEAGHLPEAVNLPLGELSDSMGDIQRDRPVVVQCQSGARSAIAASLLQAHGPGKVFNLAGGYQQWVAEGRPVQHGAGAAAR